LLYRVLQGFKNYVEGLVTIYKARSWHFQTVFLAYRIGLGLVYTVSKKRHPITSCITESEWTDFKNCWYTESAENLTQTTAQLSTTPEQESYAIAKITARCAWPHNPTIHTWFAARKSICTI